MQLKVVAAAIAFWPESGALLAASAGAQTNQTKKKTRHL